MIRWLFNNLNRKGIQILLLVACCWLVDAAEMSGQTAGDYRTAGNVTFSAATNWETFDGSSWVVAVSAPTNANGVITIQSGHTAIVSAAVTLDQLVVASGGILTVNSGQTLSITDGIGTDLSVSGTVNNSGIITPTGTIVFNAASNYNHTQNGGTIPAATWNPSSNCNITGITSATSLGGFNQIFGNFTWNCAGQTSNFYIASNVSVAGNFTVSGTGLPPATNDHVLRMSETAAGYTITVGGDFIVTNSSTFKMNNSTGSCTLNVGGNLNMNSGYITIVTGGASSTINVSGDVNISGGTLCMHEDASATIATLNLGGNFTFSGGSITEVTGRPGVIIFNNTTTVQNFRRTGGTITNNVSFTVNPNVTVDFGASDVVNGGGRFTLSNGAKLQTANISGINGSIQTLTRTLSTLANYTFDGAAAQNTGSYLPATVNNFTINNTNGVTLSQALTVNGTYTSDGQFSSAYNITYNGPTNCGGSINASAGTVTYANVNPNVIAGTYNNLSIASGVTTATLCGAINVNGNLSINGTSTLYTSTFQITGNAAGIFTMASGSTLQLGNTGSPTAVLFPTNFTTGNIILNSNSTVIYQSSGNQAISAAPVYGNLTTATGGSKILANNITVNGNIIIGAGSTLDASSGNNYSITLYGNWNHQGTFEERQGTVIFTGSNTQTITSAFSTEEFYNITVNKTGGVLRPINSSQSVQAHGNLYIQNGTYETNGAVLTVDQLTTIAGTLSTNGGTANLNNVSFTGGTIGNASATGTVNINGTLNVSAGNGTIGRVNLNVTGTTTIAATRTLSFDNNTGTKIFTGLVTNNGIWNNSANGNITFRGGLTHNGSTFTSGTGTYSFTTNTQTLGGTSTITFNGGVTVSSTLNNANTTTIRGVLGGAGTWTTTMVQL